MGRSHKPKGRSTKTMPDSEGALALLWAPASDGLDDFIEHSPAEAAWTLRSEEQTGVISRDLQRRLAGHTMLRATQLAAALCVVWFVVIGASPWLVAAVLTVLVVAGIGENHARHHWIWAIPLESRSAITRRRVILGAVGVAYAALSVIVLVDVAPTALRSAYVVIPGVVIVLGLGAIRAIGFLRRPADSADPPDPAVWPPGAEAYALVSTLAKAQSMTPAWHESVTGQPGYLIASWVNTLEDDGLLATERSWNGHIRRVAITPSGRDLLDLAREELRRIAHDRD